MLYPLPIPSSPASPDPTDLDAPPRSSVPAALLLTALPRLARLRILAGRDPHPDHGVAIEVAGRPIHHGSAPRGAAVAGEGGTLAIGLFAPSPNGGGDEGYLGWFRSARGSDVLIAVLGRQDERPSRPRVWTGRGAEVVFEPNGAPHTPGRPLAFRGALRAVLHDTSGEAATVRIAYRAIPLRCENPKNSASERLHAC